MLWLASRQSELASPMWDTIMARNIYLGGLEWGRSSSSFCSIIATGT